MPEFVAAGAPEYPSKIKKFGEVHHTVVMWHRGRIEAGASIAGGDLADEVSAAGGPDST